MKAALCKSFGGSDDLGIETLPDPTPGPDEVVVDVKAAALNFFDTLIVRNRYQYKPELPFSPCAEIAGTVAMVGDKVEGFAPGDRVAAYICYGGARSKVVVPAILLTRLPDGLSFDIAAGIPVTYGTGYYGLKDRGGVGPGDRVAVLGASGGAGLAAVELAKQLGAEVIAVASSDEKLATTKDLGADEVINYSEGDLKAALKAAGGGRGVDVIYDCVGGPYAEPALRAVNWNGRYLVIGFAAGDIPKFPLNLLLLKSVSAIGVFWGKFTEREPETHVAHNTQLMAWAAEGRLKPKIHGVFPLEDISEALKIIERREAMGKIILHP